jgi:putative ABC transport system permease protein
MSRTWRSFWTAIIVAFGALRRSPLRASLTAFGILIGVAAVTIVVALGEGASAEVSASIDSLGENAMIVQPTDVVRSGLRADGGGELTESDVQALRTEAPAIERAAPLLFTGGQVAWRDANATASVIGTNKDFFAVRRWKLASGVFWAPSAETIGEKVCVIGESIRREVFGSEDPIGQTLRINRHPFRIIGLLEAKGSGPFGNNQDDVVIMPLATVRGKISPTRPGVIHRILLQTTTPEAAPQAERQVTAILRQRHRLAEDAENDFRIRSQEEFREKQESILRVLSVLLLSIAAVSLVVGGIGVMNIMLVSVTERTREIGIRMAIGARETDILVQFLIEAVVLCLIGGLGGAALAALAIHGIASALNWNMGISGEALTVALLTSTAIGVGFGFLPARRAARLDPIHALGRE